MSAIARLPTKESHSLAVVGPEPFHFAARRPQPFIVRHDLNLHTHHVSNRLGSFTDSDLEVAAEVDYFTDSGIRFQRGREPTQPVAPRRRAGTAAP